MDAALDTLEYLLDLEQTRRVELGVVLLDDEVQVHQKAAGAIKMGR